MAMYGKSKNMDNLKMSGKKKSPKKMSKKEKFMAILEAAKAKAAARKGKGKGKGKSKND